MGRRSFTTEFKHEAVKLVRERGMTVSQASKDLGLAQLVTDALVTDNGQLLRIYRKKA